MEKRTRDLHAHSNCSDGVFDPATLVQHAGRSGVEQLSLTDHDTFAGLEEAQQKAEEIGICFMPGIELTCRFMDRIVHILGYGFRPSVAMEDRELMQYLLEVKERDHRWAHKMCRKSADDPIVVKPPGGEERRISIRGEELSWVRGTMPSPIHIGIVLSKTLAGVSDDLKIPARHCMYLFTGRLEPHRRHESFWPELRQRYADVLRSYDLAARTHWWTERPTADLLDAKDAIGAIERISGIPVLAHPGEQELNREHIEVLAEFGIRGVEVHTFKHSPDRVSELEALSDELGLFTTGGTDFHGPHHRGQVEIGRDRAGRNLTSGLSIDDFHKLGAYASGLPERG